MCVSSLAIKPQAAGSRPAVPRVSIITVYVSGTTFHVRGVAFDIQLSRRLRNASHDVRGVDLPFQQFQHGFSGFSTVKSQRKGSV